MGFAKPTPQTWAHYAEWLAQGFHGEMHYLAQQAPARHDPNAVLAGARSAIIVAKRYRTVAPADPSSTDGVISCYAWGDDYHQLMQKPLRQAADWLRETAGCEARACVDTAPVLERDLAAQAGLGWFGKHANLLSRELGNWFFLGVILTTLPLQPDPPVSEHCGSCTRCLDCCPTNAFVGPRVLDARRCISYLTIELKGPIPHELRPLMGNRIFGCDDCLAVCPWNRFAQPVDAAEMMPRAGLNPASLVELLQLNEEGFRQRFRKSPVKRAKRRGLLRNVAVALGNSGEPVVLPALRTALHDEEPLIRGHAAWAIGQLGQEAGREALAQRRTQEEDPWVREEIGAAVARLERYGL